MKTKMTSAETIDQLHQVCAALNYRRNCLRDDMTFDERDAVEDVIADLQDKREDLIDSLREDGWLALCDLSGSNVVGLTYQLSSIEDPASSDYESRILYQVIRVIPFVPMDQDKLTTILENCFRTKGRCGHSHDCCGCVSWSCEATRVSRWSEVYTLRLVGTANI